MKPIRLAFMVLILNLFGLTASMAADSCQVISTVGEMKKVQVDGATFFAITREELTRLTELKTTTAELSNKLKTRDELLRVVQQERNGLLQRLDEYETLRKRYAALQKEMDALNRDYQQALGDSINLNKEYDGKAKELVALTHRYDDHVEDWKKHAEECRELATQTSSGGIGFDLGVGVTNGESSPAALIGAHVGRLKAWGFLQEDNSGVLVGTSVDF